MQSRRNTLYMVKGSVSHTPSARLIMSVKVQWARLRMSARIFWSSNFRMAHPLCVWRDPKTKDWAPEAMGESSFS